MPPMRSVVAPVPTTVARFRNHHKCRLTNVPFPAGINLPTLQQPYDRACVPGPLPPLIQSSLQNSMVPAKPLEILAEEDTRTVQRRWTRGEVRNGHRSRGQDVAPRRGAVSCLWRARLRQIVGHLMICTSSRTLASILTHCALHTLATRKLYRHTPPTLPHLCFHTQPAHSGRHADGYGFHKLLPRPTHVKGCSTTVATHHHAELFRDTQDTEVASYQDSTGFCEDGNCSLQSAHEKLFPQTCGCQSQQNWAWRVHGAWARSLWLRCAVPPGPRDFSRCAHGNWCRRPLRSRTESHLNVNGSTDRWSRHGRDGVRGH